MFGLGSVPDGFEQQRHDERAQDGQAQNANHDQCALAVLLPAALAVCRPPGKEGVGGQD